MPRPNSSYPDRPPRLALFVNQASFYFVTFNTYERRSLLASDSLHETFVDFCRRARDHGVSVGHYALMPDHAHFFVVTSMGMNLVDWMRTLRTVLNKDLWKRGHHKPH